MKTCKECGAGFDSAHPRKVFCSIPCKHKNQYKRHGPKRRQALREKLQRIKLELGCAVCGYNKHPAALHFDHLDPSTKSFSLGNNNFPINKVDEELEKCQVLCANCHAEKTWENKHECDG